MGRSVKDKANTLSCLSIVQGGGGGQLDSLSGRAVFGSSLGATQHSQGG